MNAFGLDDWYHIGMRKARRGSRHRLSFPRCTRIPSDRLEPPTHISKTTRGASVKCHGIWAIKRRKRRNMGRIFDFRQAGLGGRNEFNNLEYSRRGRSQMSHAQYAILRIAHHQSVVRPHVGCNRVRFCMCSLLCGTLIPVQKRMFLRAIE